MLSFAVHVSIYIQTNINHHNQPITVHLPCAIRCCPCLHLYTNKPQQPPDQPVTVHLPCAILFCPCLHLYTSKPQQPPNQPVTVHLPCAVLFCPCLHLYTNKPQPPPDQPVTVHLPCAVLCCPCLHLYTNKPQPPPDQPVTVHLPCAVQDHGFPPRSSTCILNITIVDENDNAPNFPNSGRGSVTIAESKFSGWDRCNCLRFMDQKVSQFKLR